MEVKTREMMFLCDEKASGTFELDDELPALPLPALENTLMRYYESLQPFGNEKQLRESRRIIDEFLNGVGRQLQIILEERAKLNKNWVSGNFVQISKPST